MNETGVAALMALYASDEPMTTTEIAKEIFDPDDDDAVKNADRKVRYHLEENDHLVTVDESNGYKEFELAEDQVFFGVGRFNMITYDGREVDLGLGDTVLYHDADGTPVYSPIQKRDSENDL